MWRTPFLRSIRLYPMKPFQIAAMPVLSSAALGPLKYSSTTALIGLAEERISLVTVVLDGSKLFPEACLLVNTMLTLTVRGVGVNDGVFVMVGVKDGVIVGVLLGVREGVMVAVAEGVKVGVLDGVSV